MAAPEREQEVIRKKGTLTRILWYGGEGFLIGVFRESGKRKSFTAKGNLSAPTVGMNYLLTGVYETHPKYGEQLHFYEAEETYENDDDETAAFLSSKRFPGIGEKKAGKIREALGADALIRLKEDPDVLNTLDFLSDGDREVIRTGIDDYFRNSSAVVLMMKAGLNAKEVDLLREKYRDKLNSVLQRDVFEPYYKIRGFGYTSASRLANAFHYEPRDIRRIRALVYEQIRSLIFQSGSVWVVPEEILKANSFISPPMLTAALQNLEDMGLITVEEGRIYPKKFYDDEWIIANTIAGHLGKLNLPADFSKLLESVQKKLAIQYDQVQKEAIRQFFTERFSIINGGPGTGKSTVILGILQILKKTNPTAEISLCAPTGKAAKRMEEICGHPARTIHSLLRWNMSTDSFQVDDSNPLEVDIMIIDECSMIDTHLFSRLMLALPDHVHLLLIGDENQLESVGPGKVFNDLVDSGLIPVTSLRRIFRQAEGSAISSLAGQIQEGVRPKFENEARMIHAKDGEIADIVDRLLTEQPGEPLQLLAPMYEGEAGINAFNARMQQFYNPFDPNKPEIRIGKQIFRQGDRILLKKNLNEEGVYNGDTGILVKVDPKTRILTVDFDGKKVEFSTDIPQLLSHAWCISIHKSQGAEFQDVCCILPEQSRHMLSRRLIYTAVSRAKRSLTVLGNRNSFYSGIKNRSESRRHTTLKDRLEKALPALS